MYFSKGRRSVVYDPSLSMKQVNIGERAPTATRAPSYLGEVSLKRGPFARSPPAPAKIAFASFLPSFLPSAGFRVCGRPLCRPAGPTPSSRSRTHWFCGDGNQGDCRATRLSLEVQHVHCTTDIFCEGSLRHRSRLHRIRFSSVTGWAHATHPCASFTLKKFRL